MKKLFLFVAVSALTLSLSSCSKSSGSSKSLTMKVGGVKKSFTVLSESFAGSTYVSGYIGSATAPTEEISFTVATGTGSGKISNLNYTTATADYFDSTITSNVSKNTSSFVSGTFSATAEDFVTGDPITITEGTFSSSVIAAQ